MASEDCAFGPIGFERVRDVQASLGVGGQERRVAGSGATTGFKIVCDVQASYRARRGALPGGWLAVLPLLLGCCINRSEAVLALNALSWV